MQVTTIGELHEICGGTMRFGTMPPLGGEHTPLARVVHHISEVTANVIFWPLDLVGGAENRVAEEAFHQGAVGVVVTGRRVVPWAGCWSLQVPDAWSAWLNWQSWVIQNARSTEREQFGCDASQRRVDSSTCRTPAPKSVAKVSSNSNRTAKQSATLHSALPLHSHVAKIGEPDSFSMEADAARDSVMRLAERVDANREHLG